MADPPKGSSSSKGGMLSRKVGPLPLWVWGLLVVVVVYLLYRRLSSSPSGTAQAAQAPTLASSTPDSSLGNVPTAGSPQDTGATSNDLLTALGGQQSSLLSAFEAQNQDVLGLAQSQISALQSQTTTGPFNTQTQPMVGTQPGGSQAPLYVYVAPTLANTPTAPPVKTATPAKTSTSVATHYYTYKRDALAAAGGNASNVHFSSGRGYYVV